MPQLVRLTCAVLLAAGPAAAQSPAPAPRPAPSLHGAIQDRLGTPLEGAQVEILGLVPSVTTGASGTYRFEHFTPGRYWVAVRRIGYSPVRAALTFVPGDDREITFRLDPMPQLVPDLEVKAAKEWDRRYGDFRWRSRVSAGRFLTRDDITAARATFLGDVVQRYLPFVSPQALFHGDWPEPFGLSNGFENSSDSRARRLGNTSCGPSVSINGARPMGGWAVNDFRPVEVEAVEVYRTRYQMPIEFRQWNLSGCGLVVIWLR